MATITLTVQEYAELLRCFDCVQVPVAVNGYLYAVKRGSQDTNIYRLEMP